MSDSVMRVIGDRTELVLSGTTRPTDTSKHKLPNLTTSPNINGHGRLEGNMLSGQDFQGLLSAVLSICFKACPLKVHMGEVVSSSPRESPDR